MSLLRLEHFGVTPGRAAAPAISDLGLELEPGGALAIVGPSGSGKSTLARALVGLERRLTGSFRYRDRELVGGKREAWRGVTREIALCWQDAASALDPRRSVRESIDEALRLAGQPSLTRSRLHDLFDQLGMADVAPDSRPGRLSGGQRQRAALARALAVRPRVLIADEVTSALDRDVARDIVARLRTLVSDGSALLLVTHDLSLLPGFVEDVVVLDGGRIVERGTVTTVRGSPAHPTTRGLVEAIPRLHRPPQ